MSTNSFIGTLNFQQRGQKSFQTLHKFNDEYNVTCTKTGNYCGAAFFHTKEELLDVKIFMFSDQPKSVSVTVIQRNGLPHPYTHEIVNGKKTIGCMSFRTR